jgi:tetratricopeptide (TPR) repeat protein
LSIVVFAIQQQIFGDSATIRHFFNIICYLGVILALFYFLNRFLFRRVAMGEDWAFLATLLFAIHPLHTEVVANIKSLDEILSLLFTLGTLIFSMTYLETKKQKDLILGLVSFFLALLSKEYAMTLVLLIPMLFYLNPTGLKNAKNINNLLPYMATFFVYMILRLSVVGIPHHNPNVKFINNFLRMDPYYLASPVQKLATEIYVLGRYLFALFIPYPLASDYSYNQIPYHNFSDITVWLSIIIYGGLIYIGYLLLRKKNLLAFPVFFYLLNLSLVSNLFINIGGTYGERFAFTPSVGFAIALAFGILKAVEKIQLPVRKIIVVGLSSLLTLVCAAESIVRNEAWKNDNTLFLTDVKTVPNSSFVLSNAAVCYINIAQKPGNGNRGLGMLDTALIWSKKAVALDNSFPEAYMHLGLAYYCLAMPDSAKKYWDIVQDGLFPGFPELANYYPMLGRFYMKRAMEYGNAGKTQEAINDLQNGLAVDSANAEIWYNLGGAYFSENQYANARRAWQRALKLKPGYQAASDGLSALPKE